MNLPIRSSETGLVDRVEITVRGTPRVVRLPVPAEAPVYMADGRYYMKVSGWKAIHWAGAPNKVWDIVTSNYSVVPHKDIFEATREVLGEEYKPLDESLIVSGDGARMIYKVLLWKTEVTSGDEIGLGLMVTNSYDRSLGLGSYFYGLRLVCLNEMVFGREIMRVMTPHRGKTPLERFKESLKELIMNIGDVQLFLKSLIDAQLPYSTLVEVLKALRLAKKYNELVEKELGVGQVIKPETEVPLWNFYNAVTYVLTHKAQIAEDRKIAALKKLNALLVPLVRGG